MIFIKSTGLKIQRGGGEVVGGSLWIFRRAASLIFWRPPRGGHRCGSFFTVRRTIKEK